MNQTDYKRNFHVGKTYLTVEGKRVKIIAENTKYGPHYTCVQGDDGETRIDEDIFYPGIYEITEGSQLGWRYDRASDPGRCTGSQLGCPQNLVVGSEQPEPIEDMRGSVALKTCSDFIFIVPGDKRHE